MKKKNLLMTAIAIFGFATITSAQIPSYVPTNGLVGWWPFNGNADDESGIGNNGVVNGATLTTDRFGNTNSAYSFDGVNDYISLNSSNLIYSDQPRSVSVWISPSSQVGQTSLTGLSYGNSSQSNSYMIGLGKVNNQTTISVQAWANDFNCFFNYNIGDNLNIVTIYDGIVSKIFVNGQLFCEGVHTINTINGDSFYFGTRSDALNSFFHGLIDDIGIWNRALTQQEITNLYNGCQLSVNTQPINQPININNNAEFVVSSSDPSVTYQWQTDLGVGFQNLNSVGQYSGTANNTLTVSNVTMSNNNQPFRCIVSSGSCSDTSNVAVLTVNNNVGINETSQDNLFTIFPNPAQSVISVKADSKLIGGIYSIYDNRGRVVLTGKLNSENTTIELMNLSGGIYMFRVGENMKQTFEIIKE